MSFYGILGNVQAVLLQTFSIHDLNFREAALPNFSQVSCLEFETAGESALDELHRFLDRHLPMDSDQRVKVVGHDDKVEKLELVFGDEGTKHINEQACIAFGLEYPAPHACLRGYEEGTGGV